MLSLPLICVVQISGILVKKHAHGHLSDVEILLEVLPHSLHKLFVAVGVKTKVWFNQVELKICRRLFLPAFTSTPSLSSSPRPQSLATSRQPSGAGVSEMDLSD